MDLEETDNLISMDRKQSQRALFPPSCLVYVYNDHSPAHMVGAGEVTEVSLRIEDTGTTELLFTVKSSIVNDDGEEDSKIFKASQLRFRNGCPVKVQNSDTKGWISGIVLGTHDIPANSDGSCKNQYQYSIHLLGNDSSESGHEQAEIVHHIGPERVRYRPLKSSIEGTKQENQSQSVSLPTVITIKEEEEEEEEEEYDVKAADLQSTHHLQLSSCKENSSFASPKSVINYPGRKDGASQVDHVAGRKNLSEMYDAKNTENQEDRKLLDMTGKRKSEDIGVNKEEGVGGKKVKFMEHKNNNMARSTHNKGTMDRSKSGEANDGSEQGRSQNKKLDPGSARNEPVNNHWRYIRPNRSEEHCKVVNGVRYYWSEKYNSGKGMWSANASNPSMDHTDKRERHHRTASINGPGASVDHADKREPHHHRTPSIMGTGPSVRNEDMRDPHHRMTSTNEPGPFVSHVDKRGQYHRTPSIKGTEPSIRNEDNRDPHHRTTSTRGQPSVKNGRKRSRFQKVKITLPDIDERELYHITNKNQIQRVAAVRHLWIGTLKGKLCIVINVDALEERSTAEKILVFLRKKLNSSLDGASITSEDPFLNIPHRTIFNKGYKEYLFGAFKGMDVDHFKLISNVSTLPPKSPNSPYFGKEACLNYHVKGACSSRCRRFRDHRPYTDAQYEVLLSWCEKHYKHYVSI